MSSEDEPNGFFIPFGVPYHHQPTPIFGINTQDRFCPPPPGSLFSPLSRLAHQFTTTTTTTTVLKCFVSWPSPTRYHHDPRCTAWGNRGIESNEGLTQSSTGYYSITVTERHFPNIMVGISSRSFLALLLMLPALYIRGTDAYECRIVTRESTNNYGKSWTWYAFSTGWIYIYICSVLSIFLSSGKYRRRDHRLSMRSLFTALLVVGERVCTAGIFWKWMKEIKV